MEVHIAYDSSPAATPTRLRSIRICPPATAQSARSAPNRPRTPQGGGKLYIRGGGRGCRGGGSETPLYCLIAKRALRPSYRERCLSIWSLGERTSASKAILTYMPFSICSKYTALGSESTCVVQKKEQNRRVVWREKAGKQLGVVTQGPEFKV